MALPGSIIEEIVNALVSAFPQENRLLEMLRFKFDRRESDLAKGEDHKNTVFKLVEEFESKGSIIELIKKAHQQNYGNYDLKHLHKRIPEISLIEIVYPLEKDHLQHMLEVYYNFAVDNLSDWKPESVKDILDNLKNIRQEEVSENPIVKFVNQLLSTNNFPEGTIEQLNEWRSQNVKVSSDLGNGLKEIFSLNQKENKTVLTFVLILVEPSQQLHRENHKRYSVQAWFIRDGSNGISNFLPYDVYQNLETGGRTYSWEEMPSLIDDLFGQIKLSDFSNKPNIELLLPYELLQESIHNFKITEDELPVPIGSEYQVIFRSGKRLDKKYKHRNVWVQKWKLLQKCNNLCHHTLSISDCDAWETIFRILNREEAIGFKSSKLPSQEVFKVINRTGTPIALWLRNELQNENLHTEFDEILRDCPIKELPKQIKEQRSRAFGQKNKNDHIGNHLSLLWENPYIIPPEALPYTTP